MQQLMEVRDSRTPAAKAYAASVQSTMALQELAAPIQELPRAAGPTTLPPKAPIDLRIWEWTTRQVLSPGRLARWFGWGLRLYPRGRAMFSTVLGGFVSKESYARRMALCSDCDRHVKRIASVEPLRTKSYCAQCGCPEWALSRLDRKNWFKGWKCPARKHPGPYPEDRYKEFVTIAPPKTGGCGGK